MSVVLSMEEVGPCRKQLQVEIPAAAVEAEASRVVQEVAREVRVPGFRRGKVPASLVQKQFGAEIEQRLVERLVPRYWKQAAAEKELDPMGSPEVAGVEFRAGEPLRFTATVEVRPVVELRNLVDFNLPELRTEPTDEEVDAALAELRHQAADWVPAERAAAHGDRAKVKIVEDVVADEHEAHPHTHTQEVEVELGDKNVWEELTLALTGAMPGQERPFERTEGEGETARTRRFRAAVEEVRRPVLPELDDAFAAKVGRFADLGELRRSVAGSLRQARERERRRQREQALLSQLIERHPLDLPQGVLQHESEHLLREYAESLAARGVDIERSQIDWQAMAGQLKPQAERRVHARLLLDAVARDKGVAITEEEFERALAGFARAQGRSTLAVRQSLDQNGQLAGLRLQLQREKTVDLLLGETPQEATLPAPAAPPATADEA